MPLIYGKRDGLKYIVKCRAWTLCVPPAEEVDWARFSSEGSEPHVHLNVLIHWSGFTSRAEWEQLWTQPVSALGLAGPGFSSHAGRPRKNKKNAASRSLNWHEYKGAAKTGV